MADCSHFGACGQAFGGFIFESAHRTHRVSSQERGAPSDIIEAADYFLDVSGPYNLCGENRSLMAIQIRRAALLDELISKTDVYIGDPQS